MSMTGRWRLYSSGPSHFAAVLGCKAALSYSSPSVDGEGDRAKRGGGEEARPPNFPSTMLRMVPLPTLRVGRIMDGPPLPIPYPRIVPVSMNRRYRSEELRVGQECVDTSRSRWAALH